MITSCGRLTNFYLITATTSPGIAERLDVLQVNNIHGPMLHMSFF